MALKWYPCNPLNGPDTPEGVDQVPAYLKVGVKLPTNTVDALSVGRFQIQYSVELIEPLGSDLTEAVELRAKTAEVETMYNDGAESVSVAEGGGTFSNTTPVTSPDPGCALFADEPENSSMYATATAKSTPSSLHSLNFNSTGINEQYEVSHYVTLWNDVVGPLDFTVELVNAVNSYIKNFNINQVTSDIPGEYRYIVSYIIQKLDVATTLRAFFSLPSGSFGLWQLGDAVTLVKMVQTLVPALWSTAGAPEQRITTSVSPTSTRAAINGKLDSGGSPELPKPHDPRGPGDKDAWVQVRKY
jgi:hypothetical protein